MFGTWVGYRCVFLTMKQKLHLGLSLFCVLWLIGCSSREHKVWKDCDSCPELVEVSPGELWVNDLEIAHSTAGGSIDANEFRRVSIGGFLLGRTEVTRGQWRALMGALPPGPLGYGDEHPVANVSWKQAHEFVKRLSQKTGQAYRLPTEAEWVYAGRAGASDQRPFASNVDQINRAAWHTGNREFSRSIDCPAATDCGMFNYPRLSAVAQKLPNAFGLYDMYGNTAEWVEDVFLRESVQWPQDSAGGAKRGDLKVRALRGGSVLDDPMDLVAHRTGLGVNAISEFVGFRVARALPGP